MKIIKNNYCGEAAPKQIDKNNSYKVVCDKCDSELEVTKEDAYIGWSGGYYVKCPCCGEETFIPQLDVDKNYTKKTVGFPTHFRETKYGVDSCVAIDDEEVTKAVRCGFDVLDEDANDVYTWQCGDTFVYIERRVNDDDYYVIVTKDYFDAFVPVNK